MTDQDSDDGRSTGVLLAVVLVGLAGFVFVVVPLVLVVGGIVAGVAVDAGPDPTPTPTIADFITEYDDGSLTIRHAAGNELDPDSLIVTVDGDDRGSWAELGDAASVSRDGDVSVGDDLTLDRIGPDQRVSLILMTQRGPRVIFDWPGSTASGSIDPAATRPPASRSVAVAPSRTGASLAA